MSSKKNLPKAYRLTSAELRGWKKDRGFTWKEVAYMLGKEGENAYRTVQDWALESTETEPPTFLSLALLGLDLQLRRLSDD